VQGGLAFLGVVLLFLVWLIAKFGCGISDRYLPSPARVVGAITEIQPSMILHTLATTARLVVGGVVGVVAGISMALAMSRFPTLERLLLPSVQALRSVPAVATVPFFLLWFGFAESGKFLMVLLGVGLNVLVAAEQIAVEIPEKYAIALRSFGHEPRNFPLSVTLPLILQSLLPTLRTSLSITFGVVIVSELLGSQLGLGYLIQTSRTTYSIHVIFLATAILGLLNVGFDRSIALIWKQLIYWKPTNSRRNS
jgi:sulfonate transport system permease protein